MPDRDYSLARALAYLADPHNAAARDAAETERALSRHVARNPARGLVVPGAELTRTLNATTTGEGVELVGENTAGFAGALRAAMVLGRAGATILSDLRGDLSIPTITDGATAYWLAEGGNVTSSTPTLAPGTVSPKTVAASVPVSRRLMLQGNPDVAAVIAADLVAALAHEIDAAALGASSDVNAPDGLRQALSAGKVTFAAATPTWAEVTDFLQDVEDGHAAEPAFVTSPSMATLLRRADTGTGERIMHGGQIADRPAMVTPSMPAGELIAGGFGDLVIAQWGGIDLRLDTATGAASDQRILRAFADVGFLTRRTTSFAYGGVA